MIGDAWRKLGTDWVKAKEKALKLGLFYGGGKGIRTPDLRIANATLYQLSHTPTSGTIEIIAYSDSDCKYVLALI